MATPAYSGNGQPVASSGWLCGLGSLFAVCAPVYAGGGQSIAAPSGYFSGTTPTYRQASAATVPDRITLVVPREMAQGLIEPKS
jgi:hypothetical protein